MNRHSGSRQKPLPNLPSILRPALNTVMGMTVSSKVSVCANVEGTTWGEWSTAISWPHAAGADTQKHTMKVGMISCQITEHHRDRPKQPERECAHAPPPMDLLSTKDLA